MDPLPILTFLLAALALACLASALLVVAWLVATLLERLAPRLFRPFR